MRAAALVWLALCVSPCAADRFTLELGNSPKVRGVDARGYIERLPALRGAVRPVAGGAFPQPEPAASRRPVELPSRSVRPGVSGAGPAPPATSAAAGGVASAGSPVAPSVPAPAASDRAATELRELAAAAGISIPDEALSRVAQEKLAHEPRELPPADRVRNAVLRARIAAAESASRVTSAPASLIATAASASPRPPPSFAPVAPAASAAPAPERQRAIVRPPGTRVAATPFGRTLRPLAAGAVVWLLPEAREGWRAVAAPEGPGWVPALDVEVTR